jgi:hypothetical protein
MEALATSTPSSTRPPARWGQERRLEFIDFRLQWDRRLNRSDLISFFGISVPQASLDIARYTELASGNLLYDRRGKVYVASPTFEPLFGTSSPSRFLNDLLASETGVLESEASFVGWRPPLAFVPVPGRAINADTLVVLLRAVRERLGVRALYQSMSRTSPQNRILTPHAFAYDGFRWHVRAYCHSREQFRDFVIARMLEVELEDRAGPGPEEDRGWQTPVELVLAPNPKLAKAHQKAVELDYGMSGGQVSLVCRQALLFYVLNHLGLNTEPARKPEAQQVVLKNRAAVAQFLEPLPDGQVD